MRKDSGTAYLLWLLGLCGICGLHRFYLGQPIPGILYLLTFGICGVGQLIDLFLIPGEVRTANLHSANGPMNSQNIVVNIGDNQQKSSNQEKIKAASPRQNSKSLSHQILMECSGPNPEGISLAQIIIATGEPLDSVKKVVENLAEQNLLSQKISEDGIILYKTN